MLLSKQQEKNAVGMIVNSKVVSDKLKLTIYIPRLNCLVESQPFEFPLEEDTSLFDILYESGYEYEDIADIADDDFLWSIIEFDLTKIPLCKPKLHINYIYLNL